MNEFELLRKLILIRPFEVKEIIIDKCSLLCGLDTVDQVEDQSVDFVLLVPGFGPRL